MKTTPFVTISNWHCTDNEAIVVQISAASGSTPREQGAWMAVTATAITGTIGGGRMEWDAVQAARALLAKGKTVAKDKTDVKDKTEHETIVSLGPAIGQCCGGRVTLSFKRLDAALLSKLSAQEDCATQLWPVVMIYGAGHVGRALAQALSVLPLQISLIDDRPDELALTQAQGVTLIASSSHVELAENAPPKCAHVIMTQSHALDSLIAAAVLERGDFAYLGLIGSATKRASFLSAFRELGIKEAQIERLTCPIGGTSVNDKRPEVIAALTAAEVIAAVIV